MPTLAALRKASAAAEPRSGNPCVRCINRMAGDGLPDPSGGCHMLVDDRLSRGFSVEGSRFTKCFHCLNVGEKCFELPTCYEDLRVTLEKACAEAEEKFESDTLQRAVKEAAGGIMIQIASDGIRPYEEHLFGHSGSVNKIGESGVYFAKRDRSRASLATKTGSKRKADESGSEEDATPHKKGRYGVAGVRETPTQRKKKAVEAAKAARDAARLADKAKAEKIRAKRRQTKADKAWLEEYESDEE